MDPSDSAEEAWSPLLQARHLRTARFELPTRFGLPITGVVDIPCDRETCGRVVMAPPFGLSMRDLLAAAFYFLCNGFEVVRFDPTAHAGGNGSVTPDFTLGRLTADLQTVLTSEVGRQSVVVAFSLSARAALRAAVAAQPVALLLAIPVVNVQHTLRVVTGLDLVDCFLNAPESVPRSGDVLGFELHSGGLAECIDAGLHDLDGSLRDARRLRVPTTLVAGSTDVWVDIADVERVHEALPSSQLLLVEGAGHAMFRRPLIAARFLRVLAEQAMAARAAGAEAVMPPFRDVIQFSQQYAG